ncbi:beta-galactosidase GanA [Streptomonospora salina]|uniref:Beta-galactosidase GanA n=1 Tax=Streptomonospora salina TaxID=104205 RepID=A0A841ECA6_9ACTN|nr:beta-galactosidase GanA [Streptomonospora salina]
MVVAPILHMVTEERAAELARFAEGGGHLVATYFSGVVDENDHAWLGATPARCAS